MKRALSLGLALLLCLGLMPAAVWASEGPEDALREIPELTQDAEDGVPPEAEEPEEAPVPDDMELTVVADGAADPTPVHDASWYTGEAVYGRMIAMRESYPEGMPWTNANSYGGQYAWHYGSGRPVTMNFTGYGCAAFALLMSDAAFGQELPIWQVTDFSFSDVRPGDILRMNGDTHSVIVLEVHSDGVVIAEGNYNSSIHWGRTVSRAEVEQSSYMLTRWPGVPQAKPAQTPEAVKPGVSIAADGKTAIASGDCAALYARVALIIDNNGQTGLYVTQATINEGGIIVVPAFIVPGLSVKGVSIALVPTLGDVSSSTPEVTASDFMYL